MKKNIGSFADELARFHQGKSFNAHKIFGSFLTTQGGQEGALFRVWAPRAQSVNLVGDFNGWDAAANPMVQNAHMWELFVPGLSTFSAYQYAVTDAKGKTVFKADPYARHSETRPGKASKVYGTNYKWDDAKFRAANAKQKHDHSPMNIYEIHAGSWRTHEDGNFYNYRELGKQLVPYIKEMGYTHVEFMPLSEYPFDGSWGYQVMGYFAPTSRYGTPEDFMAMVDLLHQNDIGVLLDWVPAHFPKDADGLARFDGTPCYEDGNPKRGEHKEWGTLIFDFGRPEVQSFLISNAVYWLNELHVDGLRVDAVASMLYLDYNRKDGEWQKNAKGGRENLEAIAFLQKLNTTVHAQCPGAIMIAEESTAWPFVTGDAAQGGLGFDYKWNMGWMNDMLEYISTDPLFRKGVHGRFSFSFSYAFSEKYILPLSHDEVVHGKHSLLEKNPGTYEEKFAGLRAFYAYMMACPGKKLLFMGGEFGQFIEWNENQELDWLLLGFDAHTQMQKFTAALNKFYTEHPAFWQLDTQPAGLQPLVMDDDAQNVVIFLRKGQKGRKGVIALCNFSPVARTAYKFGVPKAGTYKQVFSTDKAAYGGSGKTSAKQYKTTEGEMHGQEQFISVDVPGLSVLYIETPAL